MANKRARCDVLAAATAQFYNTTGTVPACLQLGQDVSYLVTSQPTCTIVVREIPIGCTECDLIALFSRYGQVKNAKIVCDGRAGLVEFTEISSPTTLVHIAKINPFYVGPNRVYLEFSSETLPPAADRKLPNPQQPATTDNSGPTKILHLDVSTAEYPITVDVIKAICSPHGIIQRIFIGKKNIDQSLEALVEFETVNEAKNAKEQLDGADIYSGCCSLSVTYSRLQRVHVTKNDSESWDFTGPNANVEGPLNNATNQRTLLGPSSNGLNLQANLAHGATNAPNGTATNFPVASVYPAQPYAQAAYGYYGMGSYGTPLCPVPNGTPFGSSAYPGFWPTSLLPSALQSAATTTALAPIVILPTPASKHHVNADGIGIGHSTSNLSSLTPTQDLDLSVFEVANDVVLMATNLPSHVNCDHLFNLLCVYGNVARIKFITSRSGTAMAQLGSAESANLAYRHYNGITVFGHSLQFYRSKLRELSESPNLGVLSDGSPVMKNYMTDPNNRFRNAMVASKSRILEPSRTLHFFNAPLNVTPDDVCRIFTDAGATCPPRVVIFSPKPGQKTSLGLVEWDGLNESLEALMLLNHRPIHLSGYAHPFHLKLAYSPKPISDDRAGVSLIRYPAPVVTKSRSAKPVYINRKDEPTAEDILNEKVENRSEQALLTNAMYNEPLKPDNLASRKRKLENNDDDDDEEDAKIAELFDKSAKADYSKDDLTYKPEIDDDDKAESILT